MLEVRALRKSFGGVAALDGVDLTVRAGTVHALLGENGAGKSTLVKALAGTQAPDAGRLRLDGRDVQLRGAGEARAAGISVVSQELSVFPDLDVLSNLFPMRELTRGPFVARRAMASLATHRLEEMGLDIELTCPVEELSLEQRQLLEIARALISDPRVLILDEPTSALQRDGTRRLHDALGRLRDRGVAMVYVSHILEDVRDVCDEVTVLRDGRTVVDAAPIADMSVDGMVRAMLGDKVLAETQQLRGSAGAHADGRALRLRGVTVPGAMREVDFEAPAGMVVGLAGVVGAGHRGALAAVAGVVRPTAGTVELPGGVRLRGGQRDAIAHGVALVSGDRRRYGVMLDKPIWDNVGQVASVALSRHGSVVRSGRLRERARTHMTRLGIKASSVDQDVGALSGGNQQKVVFAKWLEAEPSVLLLDDPTRGIDVGAKAEIYALMRELADRGTVQVLASADPQELAAVCDRVVVFGDGRVRAVLDAPAIDAHTVLEAMNSEPAVAP